MVFNLLCTDYEAPQLFYRHVALWRVFQLKSARQSEVQRSEKRATLIFNSVKNHT